MHTYILKIIKTEDKLKPYQLIKEGKVIAEGKASSENLFRLYIDQYNPRIDFVNNFDETV
jgi:hypothetical protein